MYALIIYYVNIGGSSIEVSNSAKNYLDHLFGEGS